MITGKMTDCEKFKNIHPGFAEAFMFLASSDLANMDEGKYEIDGKNVYASVQRCEGRGKADSPLEAHRKYIDIQYVITGDEVIGFKQLERTTENDEGYNADKDLIFMKDSADAWINFSPGEFAVFFPDDAHAPLAGSGAVFKVVVKVLA